MNYTLTLRVTPAVRKYLLVHLGDEYKLSETDPIGLYLYNLLRQPIYKEPTKLVKYERWVDRHQTAIFQVSITSSKLLRERCSNLSFVTHHKFNSFVEKLLKSELHTFVDNHREFGLNQQGAIKAIMTKYDLEDSDITLDALIKSYQRFKDKQKNNKNIVAFCPPIKLQIRQYSVHASERQTA